MSASKTNSTSKGQKSTAKAPSDPAADPQPARVRKVSAASSSVKPDQKSVGAVQKTLRFWLTYPTNRIQEPLIWELGNRFSLVTNIRQATVTEELGMVGLEVSGDASEIESGIRWLKRKGVSVEPVELSTLDA